MKISNSRGGHLPDETIEGVKMAIKKAIILTIFEVSRFMTFDIIFSIFCPQCTKLSLNHYLSLIFQTPWASLGMASEMSNFRSHQKSL